MKPLFIEYKYSILGDMSHLIESLSAIEKAGILSKVGGPGWVYENEKWRLFINADRIDFFPKREFTSEVGAKELEEAFSLLDDYFSSKQIRIAINTTALYRRDENDDNSLYKVAGFEITQDNPAEFSLRFNNQIKGQNQSYVLNNIITVTRGSYNYLGNLESCVYVQFDINVAPFINHSVISQNLESISRQMIDMFKEDANAYLH